MPTHEVLIPLFEGVQPLDVTGPHEVLMGATQLLEHRGEAPGYRVSLVAAQPGPVRARSGLRLVADGPLPDTGAIGTLLVPGGTATLDMTDADPFVGWLRRAAGRAERVVSVCTGSFALAAARAGFRSAETMRRAFLRRLGVAPDHYRRRFAVHP